MKLLFIQFSLLNSFDKLINFMIFYLIYYLLMKLNLLFKASLITSLLLIVLSADYKLIKLPQNNGAACLDGSPNAIYLHQGSNKNKDSFLLFFQGGGYCGSPTLSDTIQNCYQRSSTKLGSTNNLKPTINYDSQGIKSTLPQVNPHFYDWTKAFVIYCDGSEHQGSRKQPIQYKDKQLYFRGTNNSLEVFRYFEQHYDFYNKDRIIITGVSAGGMATYYWSNYLYQHTKTSKVFSVPDSGIFLVDFYNPIAGKKVLRQNVQPLMTQITNVEIQPPVPQCILQSGDLVQCVNVVSIAKYLKAPMFIIQSVYDSWCITYVLQLKSCLTNPQAPFSLATCNATQRSVIEQYRKQTAKAINTLVGTRKDVAVWSPACSQHGFCDHPSFTSEKFKVPSSTGITLSDALNEFIQNPYNAKIYMDKDEWPCNTGCSGLTNNLSIQ